jgi:mono/diheme cytochrome c family protein/predicted  nucleic acid-binding Zn-ribbon protein
MNSRFDFQRRVSLAIACSFGLATWPLVADHVDADDAKPTDAAKVTYEEHVKPIFRQHCATCHHQGDKKGGLALDSYTSVKEGGGSGEIVYDDGDADGSRLWQLVNHDDTPVMPPNQDKIPAEQLAVIRAWIEGGILENNGSQAKAKKKNSLAFVASTGGRPEGGGAMPTTLPLKVPVVTERPAATTAIAASPWAPLVAIAGQKQIVLYHSDTHELLGVLPFPEGIAQSLRFSRDGSYLIAGGGEHSVSGVAAVYDVKTGERVVSVGDELDTVFGADANDQMNRIALGGPKKMLRIYDATDGSQLFDLKKHTDWIFTVAYSPDGILIASGDRSGGLCVWEADTGRLYLDLTEHKGAVLSVAWRDDSNVLASASEDGTVKLWDMIQGKSIKSINAHGGGVTSVAFDHQGRLVTAGKDKRAKLWDASGNPISNFEPMAEDVLEVAIAHDGKRVIYGDWTGQVVSAAVEDPKQLVSLAANPPPATERLEEVKKAIEAVRAELQPLQTSLEKTQTELTAAVAAVDGLNSQINAKRQEAKSIADRIAATRNRTAQIDNQLPTLTSQSRDAQDAVTAVRVGLQAGSATSQTVADAEQKLGEQLMALSKLRRERVDAETGIAKDDAAMKAMQAEADALAAKLDPLKKAVQDATAQRDKAKSDHDVVASRLGELQSKHDRLVAAVN